MLGELGAHQQIVKFQRSPNSKRQSTEIIQRTQAREESQFVKPQRNGGPLTPIKIVPKYEPVTIKLPPLFPFSPRSVITPVSSQLAAQYQLAKQVSRTSTVVPTRKNSRANEATIVNNLPQKSSQKERPSVQQPATTTSQRQPANKFSFNPKDIGLPAVGQKEPGNNKKNLLG